MTVLYFILLLAGAICFGLAAFNQPVGRLNLVALGLMFCVLVPLLQLLQRI